MIYVASPRDRPWVVAFQGSLEAIAEAWAAQPEGERARLVVVASQDGHARELNGDERAQRAAARPPG